MTPEKQAELSIALASDALLLASKTTSEHYRFTVKEGNIQSVFAYYDMIKQHVKSHISNDEFRQDRHKIAATILISIMEVEPIEVVKHPLGITTEEATRWINEKLGLGFAEYIIFSFLDIPDVSFKLPKKTTCGKPYEDFLYALTNSYYSDMEFNSNGIIKSANYILSLSHIFYLLERYTLD